MYFNEIYDLTWSKNRTVFSCNINSGKIINMQKSFCRPVRKEISAQPVRNSIYALGKKWIYCPWEKKNSIFSELLFPEFQFKKHIILDINAISAWVTWA